jgi:hypothetical protein
MLREDSRAPGSGYCLQILTIDGQIQDDISNKSFYIENISRGGFRFVAEIDLEIDSRLQVLLRFPDEHTQEVLGRICYSNAVPEGSGVAYGFSVIEGFYSISPKEVAVEK